MMLGALLELVRVCVRGFMASGLIVGAEDAVMVGAEMSIVLEYEDELTEPKPYKRLKLL